MADKGLTMEIVSTKFNAMLRELAAIDTAVEFRDVVRSEAAAVAAGAMTRTKVASIAKINNTYETALFTTFNGKKYFLENHYSDALWGAIEKKRRESLMVKLAARGISKQSWAWVTRAMGGNPKAPAYILAANYKGQQYPQDGASSETGSASAFTLTITNSSPVVQKAGGNFALLVSMNARARYFERNMTHHFARTLESRAKKYPGIFTSGVPAAASAVGDIPSGS